MPPLLSVFEPVTYDNLPGWSQDDHASALEAFQRSARHVLAKPYRSGSLGVSFQSFEPAYFEARAIESADSTNARSFFERHFFPARVRPEHGASGFVTGFYEPEVAASPGRTADFTVPILCRPSDLVDLDNFNRPSGLDPYLAFGRQTGEGIVEYYDRREIELGAIDQEGLAIAWIADKVDAFFIHVQGAARLVMPDGTLRRITYAAKSRQRFTGPGRLLVDLGEIPLPDVTMQSIRAWFAAHPDRIDEILWQNRSYIFFCEAPVEDASLGPIAAAKVPLTPGRSVAVDRLLHTFGTPFFIHAPDLSAFDGRPFARLMIAQDTGSAILGTARGDLFAGSGQAAGEIAGIVRHQADFYALLPRTLAEESLP